MMHPRFLLAALSIAVGLGCHRSQNEPAPEVLALPPAASAPSASAAAPPPARLDVPWIVASGECHRLRAYPLPGGTLFFAASSHASAAARKATSSALYVIDGSGAPNDVRAGLRDDLPGTWMEAVEIYGRWPEAAWLVSREGIFAHRGGAWEKQPEHKGFRGAADWTNGRVVTFDAALELRLIDGAPAPDLPRAPRSLFCAGYSHPWRSDVVVSDAAGDLFILGGCPAFGSDPWGHNATKAAVLMLPKDGKPRWELPPGDGSKFPSGFGAKVWARSASDVYVGGMMVERANPSFMMFDFYLAHFDGAKWTRIPPPTEDEQMVLGMAGDEAGALWVATQKGLFTWKGGAWTEKALPAPDSSSAPKLRPRTLDRRDGTLWMSAGTSHMGDGNGVADDAWIVNLGAPSRARLACDSSGPRPAIVPLRPR